MTACAIAHFVMLRRRIGCFPPECHGNVLESVIFRRKVLVCPPECHKNWPVCVILRRALGGSPPECHIWDRICVILRRNAGDPPPQCHTNSDHHSPHINKRAQRSKNNSSSIHTVLAHWIYERSIRIALSLYDDSYMALLYPRLAVVPDCIEGFIRKSGKISMAVTVPVHMHNIEQ
ncbi:hypothetical protein BHAP_1498 [Bifidobacterium hapali]|uniref:Uncharacterized protein n=1 Tax=Bifidobacterium hapali TaxID=1630172 RepID=A0A261FYF2_9BIFI|nr:hypothetical protein BHAP_1498 [Bifidobacterium hapali]